jgi:TLC domain
VVDLFHPKHRDWNRWLTRDDAPRWLSAANEVSRALFAVLFLLVRTAWFPYVSVAGVLRDIVRFADASPADLPGLYVMGAFNVCFSILQMYWGMLVVRQVVKIFVPDKKKAA